MRFTPDVRGTARGLLGMAAAIVVAILVAPVDDAASKARPSPTPSPAPVFIPPDVGTTAANLQQTFSGEINTKERYLAAASQADREGYPYVAQLFRACARAEQAHADLHVHAIAWSGAEAKAMLQHLSLGTTAENLRVAADLEAYEATQLYPAYLAKAREENKSAAVRSMTLALAAERQHAKLMKEALETLDQHSPTRALWVCTQCGNTVEALNFRKCPHCFAGMNRFLAVK